MAVMGSVPIPPEPGLANVRVHSVDCPPKDYRPIIGDLDRPRELLTKRPGVICRSRKSCSSAERTETGPKSLFTFERRPTVLSALELISNVSLDR